MITLGIDILCGWWWQRQAGELCGLLWDYHMMMEMSLSDGDCNCDWSGYSELKTGNFVGASWYPADIYCYITAGMFSARGMTTIINNDPFNVQNESFVALKNTRTLQPAFGSGVNRLGKYVDARVEIGAPLNFCCSSNVLCFEDGQKLKPFICSLVEINKVRWCWNNVKRTKFSHLLAMCFAKESVDSYTFVCRNQAHRPMQLVWRWMQLHHLLVERCWQAGNIIGSLFGVISLSTIQNIVSVIGLMRHVWQELPLRQCFACSCDPEYCNGTQEK